MIVVTLGNFGLGYSWINDLKPSPILLNPSIINLKEINTVSSYLLDDSFFQQVHVELLNSAKLNIVITSSTSIPIVLSFTLKENKLESPELIQTYNRYGHLPLINWHAANKKYLFLAYYNPETYEQYFVAYDRTEKNKSTQLIDFSDGITRKVSSQQIAENDVFLTSKNFLLISEPSLSNSSLNSIKIS